METTETKQKHTKTKIAQFKTQMKERNNRNRNTDRLKLLNSFNR